MNPTTIIPQLNLSDINRFWDKVAITANESKCWEWKASKRRGGYGLFGLNINNNYKSYVATRISYYINNNVDPLNRIVLHKCDNPGCVNPNHLFLGTYKENTKDMIDKGRSKIGYRKGNNCNLSKITENDVIEIRKKYLTGRYFHKDLAKEYRVSRANITNIINRDSWKHI